MNARIKQVIALSILSFITLYAQDQALVSNKRTWTVINYIAGDNDLEPFINADLREMQRGTSNTIHTLAYVSTHKQGEPKQSRRLVIEKSGIIQDGPSLLNKDSGDEQTVIEACSWALDAYPSDYLLINFWNHGSGPLNRAYNLLGMSPCSLQACLQERGVCYDDTTGNYLTDKKLQRALDALCKKRGSKIDIVTFDACLMATVEVAYTVQPYAHYLVASQNTIPGTGFNYNPMLAAHERNKLTPKQCAGSIVQAYHSAYSTNMPDYTLSAIDLSRLDPLVTNINELSQLLTQLLDKEFKAEAQTTVFDVLFKQSNIYYCTRFEETNYADLHHWYSNLKAASYSMHLDIITHDKLTQLLTDGLSLLRQCVTAQTHGVAFSKARGLSIYLPLMIIHESYPNLYWSENTKWFEFLQIYTRNIA